MLPVRQSIGGLGNLMFKQAYLYARFKDGLIPDVYVQDEKYFKEYEEEIIAMYSPNLERSNLVSLHIRRGDYMGHGLYVDLCQTDYYDRAIAEFPGEKFLVFCADRQNEQTDVSDRQWCIDWLDSKGIDYEMWYGDNEIQDFNVMAGCKGHIMANSSFSWWAAYVGGGKTVCPKDWFTDGVERISLPDKWTKL
jgi:hypothetical protein